MKTLSVVALLAVGLLGACQSRSPDASSGHSQAGVAQAGRIQAHLEFFADDLLQGRDTGSAELDIASLYIATEFKKYGLKPAGEWLDGKRSYFQQVPFRKAVLDQGSPELVLTQNGQRSTLAYPKDYITGANAMYPDAKLAGEVVFVGYGITAPNLGHDDYAGLDVTGKVVAVLSGKPQSFPSEEGAHLASGGQKQQYAVDNGAIGVLTLSTPRAEKVRPYQAVLSYIHTPRLSWLDKDGNPANVQKQLLNGAYLSPQASQALFAGSSVSLDEIYAQLEKDESPQGFALPTRVSLSTKSSYQTITSPNVVAYIEGSDPELKNEYVVYSAHSDHIGVSKSVKKDRINNGAMDNGTGLSVMLETARLFSQLPVKPKRSILFVAVTAEEKGLLGSDYFAQNPTVPLASMVANINLDMPILTYEFADVIAFGANHSSLQKSVDVAAQAVGIKQSPDPMPDQALFTRSDHYSFVKQGIPAVFLVPGFESADPKVNGAKKFSEFLSTHYHKPSDDLNQVFNWQAATKFTEVNFQIGMMLANDKVRPNWNEGDFFGDTFAK